VSWYCDVAPGHPVHGPYHDTEYGFPARDDAVLLERLALEILQAGLSWELVLRRRPAVVAAFGGFHPPAVAAYREADRARLLADPGVIRNARKIDAIIHDAGVVVALAAERGSFAGWLDAHHPLPHAEWVRLFRRTFRFTGPEVTGEFLMSLGYLPGAHRDDCPVAARILAAGPPWAAAA
jgi:DNA-3-methyladenine glycosylase I